MLAKTELSCSVAQSYLYRSYVILSWITELLRWQMSQGLVAGRFHSQNNNNNRKQALVPWETVVFECIISIKYWKWSSAVDCIQHLHYFLLLIITLNENVSHYPNITFMSRRHHLRSLISKTKVKSHQGRVFCSLWRTQLCLPYLQSLVN